MSNSNTSRNTSASCSLEVRHFGNLLHRAHLRISNVYNFLLVNENIKSGELFSWLDINEHFGTKFIVIF